MEEVNRPLFNNAAQVDKLKAHSSQTEASVLICMAVEVQQLLKNAEQVITIQFCSVMIQLERRDKPGA